MIEDQTPQGTEQEQTTPQPSPEAAPVAPQTPVVPVPEIDYKKKFSESSREAQLLASQKKAIEERLNKLTSQDAPTDAELHEEYPLWDSMNPTEQDVYRKLLTERKARQQLQNSLLEITSEQKWRAEFGGLLKNPAYSDLASDSDFETFVFQPKNKGIDIETLANSYLYSKGKAQPAGNTPEPQAPIEGLERGSGGSRTIQEPGISAEESAEIMKTDPKRFREMLVKREIKF